MRLIDSLGPNPRMVRMYLAEKGIVLDRVEVDLVAGANREAPYADKNPGGQMPSLELDDGRYLAETVAICEYLEELHPEPPLVGTTPEERAETRMWQRRVEFGITENLYNGFRFAEGLPVFKDRMHCLPEAAAGLKEIVQEKLAWLDPLLAGKSYVVGERFTLVDIILFAALDFGAGLGQGIAPELGNVTAWFDRVAARASAEASLTEGGGMRGA